MGRPSKGDRLEFKNAEQDRVINGNGQSKEFIIKRLRRITRNLFQIGSLEHFQFGPFLGHFQLGPIMGHFQPIKLDFIYHSKSPIHICSFIISPLSWNHRSFIITNPFLFLFQCVSLVEFQPIQLESCIIQNHQYISVP